MREIVSTTESERRSGPWARAEAEAQAKVAHDAILFAMHKSGFKKNCTVKGGVVMCELTKAIRRTTMDIDIDFVRYSISESSVRRVVARWARASGLRIAIFGTVKDLRQDCAMSGMVAKFAGGGITTVATPIAAKGKTRMKAGLSSDDSFPIYGTVTGWPMRRRA